MAKQLFYLFAAALMLGGATVQAANDTPGVIFICHSDLHYSKTDVKFAYRGFFEHSPSDNRSAFQAMLKQMGTTEERYRSTWSKMAFRRGLSLPTVLADDAHVIKWVAAEKGRVGYVHTAPTGNADVVVCGN